MEPTFSLSINCLALQTWGLLQRHGILSKICYYVFLFGFIFFLPSQFIELWVVRNYHDNVLKNLSVTLLSIISYMKAGTFLMWKSDWNKIIKYISDIELSQRIKRDAEILSITKKYTKYLRNVTYLYWSLVLITVIVVIFAPVLAGFLISSNREQILSGAEPYPEIMSSWVPFDKKSSGSGYFATFILQATIYVWGAGLVGTYDSAAFAMMTVFAGQFKILKIKCERIYEDGTVDSAKEKIKDCYQHHESLIKHCNIFNSLLSPCLFLYVIVCSIMICATASGIKSESSGMMQKIWLAEYTLALITQLGLYCWHSTELQYSGKNIEYAVFSSKFWYNDFSILHRDMLLISGKMRKTIVLKAGPFTNLDIAAFITILKCAYSYYSLLN